MPKGKGKASKKSVEPKEPDHDPNWERAIANGTWEQPVPTLPSRALYDAVPVGMQGTCGVDAQEWPTWGALRERLLKSVRKISVSETATVLDGFPRELTELSPEKLTELDLHGSCNLRKLLLSPIDTCPNLTRIDLSRCDQLDFVMIQSHSVTSLDLSHCLKLTKILIQCRNLEELRCDACESLETVMIWSDRLQSIDLMGSRHISKLKLVCPCLTELKRPPIQLSPKESKVHHEPIYKIVGEGEETMEP